MALPGTDNCNGTAGTLSSNWTNDRGNLVYNGSGKLSAIEGGVNLIHWNADGFSADQYAQCAVDNTPYAGDAVRITAGGNCYAHFSASVGSFIQVLVGYVNTTIQTLANPGAAHTTKLTVAGTTLKAYVNGTQTGTDQSDATYASGAAGPILYNGGNALIDDIEVGNLGAAAPAGKPWLHYAQMRMG